MSIYVSVHTCVYRHLYTYVYTYAYTYVYTYVYMYVHVIVYVYTQDRCNDDLNGNPPAATLTFCRLPGSDARAAATEPGAYHRIEGKARTVAGCAT